MPLYEYVCNDCDDKFDKLVRSFSAADEVSCESCSSDNVRRVASTFAAVGGLDDPITPLQSSGGGCCGGSCGCGH
ncbi:MAG TPA: zinc ribbon domain-containing protein [Chloroflexota bacterium]